MSLPSRVIVASTPFPLSPRGSSLLVVGVLLALGGRAEAGPISANPASLNFGNVGVGAPSVKKTVTLTNTGNGVAAINSISVGGANAGDFTAVPSLAPPLNLGAGATLTVDVTFAPQAGGNRAGTLTVAVGGGLGNTDVLLSGVALGPQVSVTPSPINAGGVKLNGSSTTKVTVANAGGGTVNVSALALGGANANAFTLSGQPNFPTALAAGKSFDVNVGFTSAVAGTFNATLTVTSDDPNTPSLVVPIKGTAGDPAIATDAGTVAFGSVRVGQTSNAQTITVSNPGLSDLHVTMVTLDAGAMGNGNPGDFVLTPVMPTTVKPGGTMAIKAQFKPTATGSRLARVVIASDDPMNASKYVTLLGTGSFAMLSTTPANIDFKEQTALVVSKPQTVTFSNAGDSAANIVGISFTGPQASWFRTAGVLVPPISVPAMGKLNVDVVTVPMALGMGMATVTFTTDEPKTPSFSVPLQVTATGGLTTVNPTFVEFGLVTAMSKRTQTITVSNNGTGPISLSAIDLVTQDPSFTIDKVPDPLPVSVDPGKTLSFDVSCSPQMQGVVSAEVDITLTGDPKVRAIHVPIDCIGAVSTFMVTPTMLTFAGQLVGATSAPQLVTLTNTGTAPATLASTSLSGGNSNQFTFEDPGKVDLLPGRSKVVAVSCAPTMAGSLSATLGFTFTGLPAANVKLSCTSVAATLMAGAGQTAIDFGDIFVGTTSEPQTITLRTGSAGLAITNVVSSDPAFFVDESGLKRSLGPLAQTSFQILFAPTASGSKLGKVDLFVNGGKSPALTISVKGSGITSTVTKNMNQSGGCSVALRTDGADRGALLLSLAALALVLSRSLRRARPR